MVLTNSEQALFSMYLGWLDKYERQEGENFSVGLILCTESRREELELLKSDRDGILVRRKLLLPANEKPEESE